MFLKTILRPSRSRGYRVVAGCDLVMSDRERSLLCVYVSRRDVGSGAINFVAERILIRVNVSGGEIRSDPTNVVASTPVMSLSQRPTLSRRRRYRGERNWRRCDG